ncbi:hypothetical protein KJ966_07935 [bacterium]|nr:hypothetical protein [bacterium]
MNPISRNKFYLKKLLLKTIQITLLFSMILGGWSVNLVAQINLHIGFTQEQFTNSLALNQDWNSKEMTRVLWPLVYSQLWILGPAPEYQALPGLAMKWETEDNRTWKFYLTPEASFSDGYPVTARDVVFSLELLSKQDLAWKTRDMNFESFEVIDDYTFKVTLMEAYSGSYPPFFRKPVLPRHIWENHQNSPADFPNSNLVGSGPYQLAEPATGEMIRLIARENRTGIEAKYDALIFLSFANSQLMVSALKQRIIDLLGHDGIDPLNATAFDSVEGIKNIITEGTELHWLSFNLAKKTSISNIDVRKAIMHSINRKEIIAQVFRGYAREISSFIYAELINFYPTSIKYNYDPNEAIRILDRADYIDTNNNGIRNDRKLNQDLSFSLLVLNNNESHIDMANLIKKQALKIGIQINLMKVAPFIYYSFLTNPVGGGFDIAINSQSHDPVSVNDFWNTMRSDEDLYNNFNSSHYINYAFDRILDKMLTTSSFLRQSKYLQLMQEILAEDLPYGLLVRQYKICPARDENGYNFVKAMGGISSGINIWSYVSENTDVIQENRVEGVGLSW